jgi:threonine dehydratase
MVGGHAPHVENEVLYRFIFPERPGALSDFLCQLRSEWNISLFHYRNHGADFGRVLVGMQVPAGDKALFEKCLRQIGYAYVEETLNPAYGLFLGGGGG